MTPGRNPCPSCNFYSPILALFINILCIFTCDLDKEFIYRNRQIRSCETWCSRQRFDDHIELHIEF